MRRKLLSPSWSRRELLAAGAAGLLGSSLRAAPSAKVAVAKCTAYDAGVLAAMKTMFDQIGGIGPLVAGKTVAVKINMSGPVRARTGYRPAWYTHWSHPAVVGAAVYLIGAAGASRIRIVEGSSDDDHPLEENILLGGWDPDELFKAARNVEMENTSFLGQGKRYETLKVAGGGLIYPAFDFNHSYIDCDVLVSIAKLKEHRNTGVSLSLKNLVGAAPGTIYGDAAGYDAPAARPFGARTMFHNGSRQPPEGTAAEKDPNSPREYGYRVPRITVDIVRARPIDLAIIDGIETQTVFETAAEQPTKKPVRLVKPGVLVAGRNPVCTDAVAMAVMGFDPMADRGAAPFETSDSTLRLAEEAGVGTRGLRNIEVAGVPITAVRMPFRGAP
jgi:uncharacterized protein (DUF362 family)